MPGSLPLPSGFRRNVLSESPVVFKNSGFGFSKKVGLVSVMRQLGTWALYEWTPFSRADELGQRLFSTLFLLSQLGLLTTEEWNVGVVPGYQVGDIVSAKVKSERRDFFFFPSDKLTWHPSLLGGEKHLWVCLFPEFLKLLLFEPLASLLRCAE